MPTRTLTGQCLCGAIHYTVADTFHYAMYCHCSQCRRATGAACKPFAGIPRQHLALTQGEPDLHIYTQGGPNHDAHCRHCGSLLYSVVRNGTYAHITMGTLTDPPSIHPTQHIFVGSKAPWHTITDTLPQFDAFPPPPTS